MLVRESAAAVQEARRTTSTIPIVMAVSADPLGAGLIDSLAHPGGNITGLSLMVSDIVAKRLQLFKEAVPGMRTVGILYDSRMPFHARAVESLKVASRSLGLTLKLVSATSVAEVKRAISSLRSQGVQGILGLDNPFFHAHRKSILDLAMRNRIPVSYGTRSWVDDGALLSYSANLAEQFRRSAYYVARIFRGAKPSELPVEQPTKFELVVNLKTAKTLGLRVPESIKVFATEIVQ